MSKTFIFIHGSFHAAWNWHKAIALNMPGVIVRLIILFKLGRFYTSAIIAGKLWASSRVYIECSEVRAITPALQRILYRQTPCQKVIKMKSGHSPFFSQPEAFSGLILDEI